MRPTARIETVHCFKNRGKSQSMERGGALPAGNEKRRGEELKKIHRWRSSSLTGTVIYARRGWKVALNGGLAEQIDRIRVGSGRVGAHTRGWFQAFASAHQEHLVRRDHAAFSLDRFLQLGDTAQKREKEIVLIVIAGWWPTGLCWQVEQKKEKEKGSSLKRYSIRFEKLKIHLEFVKYRIVGKFFERLIINQQKFLQERSGIGTIFERFDLIPC